MLHQHGSNPKYWLPHIPSCLVSQTSVRGTVLPGSLLALLQEIKSIPGFLPSHCEWLFLRTRHCSVHSAPVGISLTLILPDGPDHAYLGFSLDSCQAPALSLSTHSCKVGRGPGTAFDRTAPVFPSLASGATEPCPSLFSF